MFAIAGAVSRRRFSPCHIEETPLSYSAQNCLRPRKVHAADRDIRTSAYLNRRKVDTVKKLLGSRVMIPLVAVELGLLSGDYRIATTGLLLEAFAIQKADTASYKLNQTAVL